MSSRDDAIEAAFARNKGKGEMNVGVDFVPTQALHDHLSKQELFDATEKWNQHSAGRFTEVENPREKEQKPCGISIEITLMLMLLMLAAGATGGYLYGSAGKPFVG